MTTTQEPIVQTRQALIEHTTARWQLFVAYLDVLTDDQWMSPVDGAGWSVKDHVTHVTAWDRAVVALFSQGTPMHQTLGVPEEMLASHAYDPMNEQIRNLHTNDSLATVKADRDATWTALVGALESLSDEQLQTPAARTGLNVQDAPQLPLLQKLVTYLGGHYDEHLEFIRDIVSDNQAG